MKAIELNNATLESRELEEVGPYNHPTTLEAMSGQKQMRRWHTGNSMERSLDRKLLKSAGFLASSASSRDPSFSARSDTILSGPS